MEITAIEKKTFEQMQQAFENFTHQVKELCGKDRNNEQWLNNSEVCGLLQISLRTLQSYRDNGILPYSQIGHKSYYRVLDIEQFINKQQIKNERR
jgi:hypothetical protein